MREVPPKPPSRTLDKFLGGLYFLFNSRWFSEITIYALAQMSKGFGSPEGFFKNPSGGAWGKAPHDPPLFHIKHWDKKDVEILADMWYDSKRSAKKEDKLE